MNEHKIISERGQSLVIIALGLFAFVAILALVLDGANAYAAKRQAQNAADAGALAGAQYMCANLNTDPDIYNNTVSTANYYAGLNGADDPADVDPNLTAATVVVTAKVTKNTFFAGVIGFPQVSPVAVAEAACQNPGAGVLPVAWSCRATAEGGIILPGDDCAQKIKPPNADPYDLDYTYVVMDSVKVKDHPDPNCDPEVDDPDDPDYCYEESDIVCADPVYPACSYVDTGEDKIDCDINDDCIDELMTGGARAWLDLDEPGGGADQLKDWISNPENTPEVCVHDWLSSAEGTATSIFRAATGLAGKDVILPVFNIFCGTGAPDIYYELDAQELKDGWEPVDNCTYTQLDNLSKAGSNNNYHIYSFSAFHVTCVQTGKNKNNQVFAETGYDFDNEKDWCNGHYAAWKNGSIDDNDKTIEGYFIVLNLGGYSGPGAWNNTGTFTVVLVR